MSGDRTTPRFEVIASTRRSWSVTQKRAIVGEIGVGEATLSDVARRLGIHTSLLFRWRRDLGDDVAAKVSEPRNDAPSSTRPALSFVPVMLPPPAIPMSTAQATAIEPGLIEIVIAGGRTVRVGPDVDAAALVRIIAALETCP
jgi:transposase